MLFVIIMFNVNVLFYLMALLVYSQQLAKNSDNYGPYTLDFKNFTHCKGPKANNMTLVSTALREDNVGIFNFTFIADTKLDEIKVRVYNVKENKKNFLWNYNLKEPCRHFSVALLIQQSLKAENCFVKKGFYSSLFALKDVMESFLGPSFFYGNYTFRADILSKKGNIACVTCVMVFSKAPQKP